MNQSFKELWFSYEGRITRSDYLLFLMLPIIILMAIGQVIGGGAASLIGLLVIWPSWVGTMKRYHDLDTSGWWVFILFVMEIIALVLYELGFHLLIVAVPSLICIWQYILLFFKKGTTGANDFGPDPLKEDKKKPEEPYKIPEQFRDPDNQ